MESGRRIAHRRSFAVLGVLVLVLAACGGGGGDGEAQGEQTDGTATQTEEATDGTASEDHEEVTLTTVSSFPRDALEHEGFWLFVENLEERAPWITFEYRGGPDVMDPLTQIEGIGSGAIQAGTLPDAYYVQQAPVAEIMKFSPYLPWEARENGVFDLYQQFHEEQLNVHLLGFVYSGIPFLLFSNEVLDSPDFSGMTMRTSSAQAPVVRALGGEVVNMPASEVFTALERGTVDGFGWASVGVRGFGWHDLVNAVYAPRFYEATIAVVINKEVWDGLDEATQTALEETMIATEREAAELYDERQADEYEAYQDAGVEQVEFTDQQAQQVLEAAYVNGWEEVGWDEIRNSSPVAQQLRDLFEEGYGENFEDAVPGGMLPSE